ncbi:uncharacterized protein LOC124258195 [Haliotis rubra]|uniref:uncharacterized protein LOC124258195 n=1 Tax=Haliotis rubra TaxID=36100 RepID=UPI001EE5036F|nr:uncharacterized protein LOC124258195 [Haliotis rubra]XP_046548209.1 uncharacterized protein LOC124258195 [Haliotis rubra]XP_046548210.1 uncharacterized protein LOC124258195 [Haliotis rubra]
MSNEMEVVLLFCLLPLLTIAADNGQHQDCPEGWIVVNRKCYKLVEEAVDRDTASSRCESRFGAKLAVIESEEDNTGVKDLIHGHGNAWIALYWTGRYFRWDQTDQYHLGFANWQGSRHGRRSRKHCTKILDTGIWNAEYCHVEYPYVCFKKAVCKPGWTGHYCERECHCYAGYLCNGTEACPYGCEPGYSGDMCDEYQVKTTVSSYCIKKRGGYYSLMVFFPWLDVLAFRRMGAVDADGEISPSCANSRFDKSLRWETRLRVQIHNESGVLKPDCPAQTVGDGILQWTFRLQKQEEVVSFEDQEYQVQCDLSEADAVYAAEKVEIEDLRERSITVATQTRVNIWTYLASTDTLTPVTNLSIGVPVRLVVTRPQEDNIVNPLFHPWNCQAASPDGKVAVQLTDAHGCSRKKVMGFGRLNETSGVHQSGIFPMFQLRGYSKVVFYCALVPSLRPYNEHVCT